MTITQSQKEILRMFKPNTYAINLHPQDAQPLCDLGLLEWVPPVWGSAPNYAITDKGRSQTND